MPAGGVLVPGDDRHARLLPADRHASPQPPARHHAGTIGNPAVTSAHLTHTVGGSRTPRAVCASPQRVCVSPVRRRVGSVAYGSTAGARSGPTRARSRVPSGGVLLGEHLALGVHAGDERPLRVRQQQLQLDLGPRQQLGDALPQERDAVAAVGGDEHRVGQQVAQAGELEVVGGVGLVDDEQLVRHRAVLRADLDEHLAHRRDLLLRQGVGGVDHVHEQVGRGRLLERGAEGLDELVGQVADEADGVGERVVAPVRGGGAPRGGVEGGEQRVLDQHARVRERVEQARLARVGVADDRDGRHLVRAGARRAACRAPASSRRSRAAASPCGCGCGGGPARSWSHRARARRCRHRPRRGHRPAGTAPHPNRAGAAAGRTAARARPAPCRRGSGRAGRRCRGSGPCGRSP